MAPQRPASPRICSNVWCWACLYCCVDKQEQMNAFSLMCKIITRITLVYVCNKVPFLSFLSSGLFLCFLKPNKNLRKISLQLLLLLLCNLFGVWFGLHVARPRFSFLHYQLQLKEFVFWVTVIIFQGWISEVGYHYDTFFSATLSPWSPRL